MCVVAIEWEKSCTNIILLVQDPPLPAATFDRAVLVEQPGRVVLAEQPGVRLHALQQPTLNTPPHAPRPPSMALQISLSPSTPQVRPPCPLPRPTPRLMTATREKQIHRLVDARMHERMHATTRAAFAWHGDRIRIQPSAHPAMRSYPPSP
jgi:hypothetical protein